MSSRATIKANFQTGDIPTQANFEDLIDSLAHVSEDGLVIGTNVQAYDADLAALAELTSAADKGIQFTGAGTAGVFDLTAAGKALLDDADAAAQRVTIGLAAIASGEAIGWSDVPITRSAANRVVIGTAGPVIGTGGLLLQTADTLGWSDAILIREAAGTFALRDAATPRDHALRLYNNNGTWDDTTNYERGFARWNGDAFEIGNEKGGTGAVRDIKIIGPNNAKMEFYATGSGTIRISGGSTSESSVQITRGGLILDEDTPLQWSGDGLRVDQGVSTNGICLYKDGSSILAQRNSTSAQTFRLYGTYTDASNYRRVALAMTTAGVTTLLPEGLGTGATGNVLHISGLPTSNPGPGILWNNAGTPAIGT